MSPARKVAQRARSRHGGPQLPRGRHRAAVVLRLAKEDVGEGVDGQAERRPAGRAGRRAGHPERLEQLGADDVEPAGAVPDLEQPTERPVADVGVVEAAPLAEALPRPGPDERVPVAARGALPPRAVRLGLGPGGVGEQLLDADPAEGRPGDVLLEPVGEVEPAGVAQPHHADGDEGLGDRAHPVLGVGVGGCAAGATVEGPRGALPDELAAADQAGDDRGQPSVALGPGEGVVEQAGGAFGDAHAAHPRTVRGTRAGRAGRAGTDRAPAADPPRLADWEDGPHGRPLRRRGPVALVRHGRLRTRQQRPVPPACSRTPASSGSVSGSPTDRPSSTRASSSRGTPSSTAPRSRTGPSPSRSTCGSPASTVPASTSATSSGTPRPSGEAVYAVAETGLALYDFATARPRRLDPEARAGIAAHVGEPVTFRWGGR